jgi:hypothetical protein
MAQDVISRAGSNNNTRIPPLEFVFDKTGVINWGRLTGGLPARSVNLKLANKAVAIAKRSRFK